MHAYTFDTKTGRLDGVIHGNSQSAVSEAPFTCNYLNGSSLLANTTGPVFL